MICYEYITHMDAYRLFDRGCPEQTVAYLSASDLAQVLMGDIETVYADAEEEPREVSGKLNRDRRLVINHTRHERS